MIVLVFIFVTVQLQVALSITPQDYTVTVTAYPVNGPFRSRQRVPLQCTITPTPPIPVMYLWRSSTPNHYTDDLFPNSTPITTVTINENHPIFGRYYCHVLSVSNHTTLAVGYVDIHVSGLMRPIGKSDVTFSPPSPLQFMVEFVPKEYSSRGLFEYFSDITYEWRHNDSTLSGRIRDEVKEVAPSTINGNIFVIPRTSPINAGTYSVRIDSFGFTNYINKTCATTVLQALKNYAIFQSVEFQAKNGNVSDDAIMPRLSNTGVTMPTKYIHVSFRNRMPFAVNVKIPLTSIGEVDFRQERHKSLLELKVFYNGEKLRPGIFTDVKRPREVYSDFILLKEKRAVKATLTLPYPVSGDEGLYELQLFLSLNGVNLGFSSDCSDYQYFLDSSDGLKLSTILVGSATLMLHDYSVPQVVITTTKQVLSAGGTETLPILTCSVTDNKSLDLLNELKWIKGNKEVALTQSSGTLAFNTASIDTILPGESYFGTYLCEATGNRNQDKVEESVHIAERAHFSKQLQSLSDISCHDISEEVKQTLLNMLRSELEFSLSTAGDGDISSANFINASLNCSSEGTIVMSVDTIYSNRNGSVTASDLVMMAEEWMNGIRTANGFVFQISPSGPSNSNFTLSTGQLSAIIILCLISIVLFIAIAILIACIIKRRRNKSKNEGLPQEYEVPLNTESIMNHSSVAAIDTASLQNNTSTDPINTSLGGQSSTTPTAEWENELPHGSQSGSQTPRLNYGSSSVHSEARLLLSSSVGTPIASEVDALDASLTCTPNCAYNEMRDMELRNPPIKDSITSSRQISMQYDYPELQFTAGHSNEALELSDAYDVITSVKNRSYFASTK